MDQSRRLTAIIEREDEGYVALCPELDVASQGDSIEEARTNLVEALTLFFESAEPPEIEKRFALRNFCDSGRGSGWLGFALFQAKRSVKPRSTWVSGGSPAG